MKQILETKINRIVTSFYIVGTLGFILPFTRDLFISMIGLALLLNNFILLFLHKTWDLKHILIFSFILFFTFSMEAIGVNTGIIFGSYTYGESLGIKLFGTPLLIGLNWLMLAYGGYEMLRILKLPHWLLPIGNSILMVIYDVIMEPVAIATDMWSWDLGPIPLQNYAAWFILALIANYVLHIFKANTQNVAAPRLFIAQFAFFIILNLIIA